MKLQELQSLINEAIDNHISLLNEGESINWVEIKKELEAKIKKQKKKKKALSDKLKEKVSK